MVWREKVDPIIRTHLEKQIAESMKDSVAYEQADDPGNAQLWVAIGNLSKEIFNLNLKVNYFEKALQEIGKKKKDILIGRKTKKKPKAL